MRRKSTGKRLRFEVFKRDHFTCQYCGAQPPDIVLVVDHFSAVASGGETTIENLISACEPCNQGKGDRAIEQRTIRPDADMLYLETQQEIAELRRYEQAKIERDAAVDAIVVMLQEDWTDLSGEEWYPSGSCIRRMLSRYSPEVVEKGMHDVAVKVGGGYLPVKGDRWLPYLWGVLRTIATETEYENEA